MGEETSVEVTRDGVKASGRDVGVLLQALIFAAVLALGVVTYMHNDNTKEFTKLYIDAVTKQTAAITDGTSAQRELNCLMQFETPHRTAQAAACRINANVR